jgi:hypothetical protein
MSSRNHRKANLDFRGQDLRGHDFSNQDLSGADFSEANLEEATLVNANLEGANFHGTNLKNADLKGAKLSGAQITLTGVGKTNLNGADLRNTVLAPRKNKRSSVDSLKDQLVKLGHTNPELRDHLRPILDVLTKEARHLTYADDAEINEAWSRGNNQGSGFPVGDVEVPISGQLVGIARELRAEYVYVTRDRANPVHVFQTSTGTLVGVADAHGPWAVEIKVAG